MFNFIESGLATQKMICDANHVTDKEAHAIQDSGLRLVHKPENLTHINTARNKRDYVEPLDAA